MRNETETTSVCGVGIPQPNTPTAEIDRSIRDMILLNKARAGLVPPVHALSLHSHERITTLLNGAATSKQNRGESRFARILLGSSKGTGMSNDVDSGA